LIDFCWAKALLDRKAAPTSIDSAIKNFITFSQIVCHDWPPLGGWDAVQVVANSVAHRWHKCCTFFQQHDFGTSRIESSQ
jgi:hypothetical protein